MRGMHSLASVHSCARCLWHFCRPWPKMADTKSCSGTGRSRVGIYSALPHNFPRLSPHTLQIIAIIVGRDRSGPHQLATCPSILNPLALPRVHRALFFPIDESCFNAPAARGPLSDPRCYAPVVTSKQRNRTRTGRVKRRPPPPAPATVLVGRLARNEPLACKVFLGQSGFGSRRLGCRMIATTRF